LSRSRSCTLPPHDFAFKNRYACAYSRDNVVTLLSHTTQPCLQFRCMPRSLIHTHTGAANCTYTGERKNVIFACSATLLPKASSHLEQEDVGDAQVDLIRLFFGGGDGNVGTAVISVTTEPNATVPLITLNDGHQMPRLAVSLPHDEASAEQSVLAAFSQGGWVVSQRRPLVARQPTQPLTL
jgi:hypothetical protein